MALPQGINFRATSGYVTDGSGEDYEIATAFTYPHTTAQGQAVGWESGQTGYAIDSRDRNSSNDRRLAGMNFEGNTGRWIEYRVDLPASGNHNFKLAMGDDVGARAGMSYELYDTSSLLTSQSSMGTSAAARWKDATATEYTNATWPGSNTAVSATFSTTICRLRIAATGGNIACIAHFYIESAGGATGQPTMRRFGGVPGMGQGQTFGRSW